jgi:hypothetical protein
MTPMKKKTSIIKNVMMVVCGLISAFFIFYMIRLLYKTEGLTAIRAGGKGAYIGAVAFPVIAIVFGFISWRLFKSVHKKESDNA